jgi:hypothetical protein
MPEASALLARASSGWFFADGENRDIFTFPGGNMLVASVIRLGAWQAWMGAPACFSLFPLLAAGYPGK